MRHGFPSLRNRSSGAKSGAGGLAKCRFSTDSASVPATNSWLFSVRSLLYSDRWLREKSCPEAHSCSTCGTCTRRLSIRPCSCAMRTAVRLRKKTLSTTKRPTRCIGGLLGQRREHGGGGHEELRHLRQQRRRLVMH